MTYLQQLILISSKFSHLNNSTIILNCHTVEPIRIGHPPRLLQKEQMKLENLTQASFPLLYIRTLEKILCIYFLILVHILCSNELS